MLCSIYFIVVFYRIFILVFVLSFFYLLLFLCHVLLLYCVLFYFTSIGPKPKPKYFFCPTCHGKPTPFAYWPSCSRPFSLFPHAWTTCIKQRGYYTNQGPTCMYSGVTWSYPPYLLCPLSHLERHPSYLPSTKQKLAAPFNEKDVESLRIRGGTANLQKDWSLRRKEKKHVKGEEEPAKALLNCPVKKKTLSALPMLLLPR